MKTEHKAIDVKLEYDSGEIRSFDEIRVSVSVENLPVKNIGILLTELPKIVIKEFESIFRCYYGLSDEQAKNYSAQLTDILKRNAEQGQSVL